MHVLFLTSLRLMSPYETFSSIVVSKRTGSWETRPIFDRSQFIFNFRMSTPSIVIEPPSIS